MIIVRSHQYSRPVGSRNKLGADFSTVCLRSSFPLDWVIACSLWRFSFLFAETVRAKYGLSSCGFKRNASHYTAEVTWNLSRAFTFLKKFLFNPTIWTAYRVVCKLLDREKLLLAGREVEGLSTVAAFERSVFKSHTGHRLSRFYHPPLFKNCLVIAASTTGPTIDYRQAALIRNCLNFEKLPLEKC